MNRSEVLKWCCVSLALMIGRTIPIHILRSYSGRTAQKNDESSAALRLALHERRARGQIRRHAKIRGARTSTFLTKGQGKDFPAYWKPTPRKILRLRREVIGFWQVAHRSGLFGGERGVCLPSQPRVPMRDTAYVAWPPVRCLRHLPFGHVDLPT